MNDTGPNSAPRPPDPPPGFWGVEPRNAEDGSPDINFRVFRPNAPQDQRDLKNSAERTLTIVKALYKKPQDERKLREAVAKLLALCQVGLVGDNASPAVALDALRALESDIVEREAGPIKNQYMRKLGGWSALFGLVGLAAYFTYDHFPSLPFEQIERYRNIFLVWAGCMAGAWASFASRKATLAFSDLVALEEDRVEPQLRLLFTGVLTIILALIFITGAADIHIGTFRASSLMRSGSVALLLGAFAGLAEKALPSAVMSRANTVISAAHPS
jgi:hypothetical protein